MATQLPVWNLKDILNPKDIDRIIKEIEARIARLAKKEKQYNARMSVAVFKRFMLETEQLERGLIKLQSYAHKSSDQDTRDQKASALKNRAQAVAVEASNKLLFMDQRFKQFDEKNARRIIKGCPEFAHHLKQMRLFRKYTLSDAEEKIISIKDINGASALSTVYSITTTGFRYKIGKKEIGQSELMRLVHDPSAAKRKQAYGQLFDTYGANKELLGSVYHHIADDWRREAEMRGYASSISIRNAGNEISDEAVETLLKVCRKNVKIFQPYFRKKGKLLGKKMTRYDMYAPIEKKKQKITYKQATELVLSMFNDFHPKFGGAAQRVVRENHIHAQILPNKQTGAYCSSPVPGMTPYILISFTDDMSSTRTLAHELGHAIHGILAGKQNYYNFDTPTQICETASIFSELLLQDRLTRDNPKLARPLQAAQLDDAFVAIIREAYITFFEIDAHKMVAEHASVDQLTDRYNQLLKEQFSPAVSVDKKVGYEWLYIQHVFHWPYYCYAYTFGALLALALFAQWKKNPAFADTIVKFLEKGGSESPERMVKAAGFDLKDEKFWQSGFDVIKKMIKEL